MTSMIFFGLKRKLWNSKYLLRMIILFICVGFIMNIDILYKSIMSYKIEIALDSSVKEFEEYLQNTDTISYVYEADIRLVYDDKWKLYTNYEVPKEVISEISKQIEKIPGNKNYLNYEFEIYHSRIKDESMELIIYTIMYFLFISKSISIVQEIIEDKICGMTKIYLTSMTTKKYVMTKICEGWIQILIENILILLFGCIWIILRFGAFVNNGLKNWIESWFVLDLVYLRLDIVIFGVFLLIIGLLAIQYIIIVYMSKAKTIEETNHMTLGIHIIPIGIYYFCFSIYRLNISKYLYIVPFIQTLLLPMGLSFEGKITPFIVIGCMFLVFFVFFTIIFGENITRRRIMNI